MVEELRTKRGNLLYVDVVVIIRTETVEESNSDPGNKISETEGT